VTLSEVNPGDVTHSESGSGPIRGLGAVAIGRNEGDRLIRCLRSLVGSCGTIVYVDSGSSDGSVAAATALGVEAVELDLSTPFTAARARNAGFRRLAELTPDVEFVQFIDGDCEIVAGWAETATRFLNENPEVAVVCGRRLERFPDASIYNEMCHREWNTPVGEALACGGDSIIRAAAFEAVGGFSDAQIAHEEPELCGRLRMAGHRIWRIDAAMTLHDAAIYRLGQFYTRNRRAGFGFAQVVVRSGWNADRGAQAILRRAFTWAVAIPVTIGMLIFMLGPSAVLFLLVYPLQLLRQAVLDRQGVGGSLAHRLKVAALGMICKVAEAHGAIQFAVKSVARRKLTAIYYK
jgi:cellulose synthase/poly-beta-1,6-N-acetylglucosamine synthase-like glycosyltransferase